ncbi:hypothetical protein IWX84_003024 [Flavobacterium sp. CG_9.10]|uniref:hypothetical protein n=1 Tax=Flavobacterium sp. CG_9.10 TaxID=2787729 RepID=UPI0018C996DE|nr:hypothetical protein [Flavobacterium sp. CG_9.10]MBG6112128.1 hypothetical protein [Flavobacterium sp. CG_9.10]
MDVNAYGFLLKYSSPFSILVVTNEDKLIELKCPFKVAVITNVKNMMVSQIKDVSQVKLATNNKLVYIIEDKPYFYYYFTILL